MMRDPKLTRRQFLRASAAVLAGMALPRLSKASPGAQGGPTPAESVEMQRPNIIFIFADQLRACSVGCYGNPEVSTPHIDQLATEGVLFLNAISESPLSSPYRACLYTGRYPTVTDVMAGGFSLPVDEITLAQVLGPLGYHTGFIGKWYVEGHPPGFDPCVDPGYVIPERRHGFKYFLGFNFAHVYYGGQYYLNNDPILRQIPPGVYEADFQTDRAIDFIAAYQAEPFCLFVSTGPPHQTNCQGNPDPPGGDYHFPYDPDSLTLRPNMNQGEPGAKRAAYARCYGMTSNFDWNVGRIVATLDSLGLADNTILCVSSDHGDTIGSHYVELGYSGKKNIFAESLNVPLILRYPARIAPQVVQGVFRAVDVMPTLLGLSDAPVPSGVMGFDWSPFLLRGEPPLDSPWAPSPSRDRLLAGMFIQDVPNQDWVGVVSPQYTYECRRVSREPTRLFDNFNDPYQMANLVNDPGYASLRAELAALTDSWMNWARPERSHP
jgi:arylsulfatase A-like enzyme